MMRGSAPAKRFIAVALALAVSAAGALALSRWGGVSEAPAPSIVTYPAASQASDFGFMERAFAERLGRGEHPKLILGSSELAPDLAGPAHPAALFTNGRYGIDAFICGRASTTDLWHAIELGAFADKLEDKRVVFFASMQWYMCYRNPAGDFGGMFSEGAYQAFMGNESLSEDLKRRVAERMADYGVDRARGVPVLDNAVRAVDAAAGSLVARARARWQGAGDENRVPGAQTAPAEPVGEGADPDWEAIFAEAAADAEERSSGNAYGFYDSWYDTKFEHWLERAQKRWKVEDGAYFSQQELEDFKLALEVCREAGITPLVVLQPVKGEAYDQTIYTREVRQRYYDMIRTTCSEAGVEVADFSDREYDPLFLRDYSHPSALGGAAYSRAIYDWFQRG